MSKQSGLRERKKSQQRELIVDAAARLFGLRGFDSVSMAEVARAADVSDQTVYNYFPTKPDLVLDRADEYRDLYSRAVRQRPHDQSPADTLRPLLASAIDFYLDEDPILAKGEFPALCLQSDTLRRFALELREQRGAQLAAALTETDPAIPGIIARAHAAALVSVVQSITDATGQAVIDESPPLEAAARMRHDAATALDQLDAVYRNTLNPPSFSSKPNPPHSKGKQSSSTLPSQEKCFASPQSPVEAKNSSPSAPK